MKNKAKNPEIVVGVRERERERERESCHLKNRKGSVTLYVLIAGLFLIILLLSLFVVSSNKQKTQVESQKMINQQYDKQEETNLDQIYAQVSDNLGNKYVTKEEVAQIVAQILQQKGYDTAIKQLQQGDDTGWIKAELTSNFKPYNDSASLAPEYRKIGKMIQIRGVVTPTSKLAGSMDAKTGIIFYLPKEYTPKKTIYTMCQGSGRNVWLLTISQEGFVGCSRYGTTSVIDIPATAWLPFQITYMKEN